MTETTEHEQTLPEGCLPDGSRVEALSPPASADGPRVEAVLPPAVGPVFIGEWKDRHVTHGLVEPSDEPSAAE